MNNTSRKDTGKIGEILAQKHLESFGYRLFEKNYNCRYGEIDIIAGKENILIFVEVKIRTTDLFGKPAESVGIQKIKRIRKISELYMSRMKNINKFDIRFDIISLFIKKPTIERLRRIAKTSTIDNIILKDFKDSGEVKLEHLENAF